MGRSGVTSWLSRDRLAVIAGLAAPLALIAVLVPFRTSFPNTDAALVLVLVVVLVAAAGSRLAGLLAAVSAAVWFDFFLTRPFERFSITRATDIGTTLLLLGIGIVVTEIAVWGRRQNAAASQRAGYLRGINAAAAAVAAGGSATELIDQVSVSLTQLLSLRSCQFQRGMAGVGRPARIQPDGTVTLAGRSLDPAEYGLPTATGTELLVESGGRLEGRYLLQPDPAARPGREQVLVALALADQVGAALSAGHPASRH
jgi:K+-sensing histidine kinase KdpD